MSVRFHRSPAERRVAVRRRAAFLRKEHSWDGRAGQLPGWMTAEDVRCYLGLNHWRTFRPFGCPRGRNCPYCHSARGWRGGAEQLPLRDRRRLGWTDLKRTARVRNFSL